MDGNENLPDMYPVGSLGMNGETTDQRRVGTEGIINEIPL